MVHVSALKALEGDQKWGAKLLGLTTAVDEHIPPPLSEVDRPFIMAVED